MSCSTFFMVLCNTLRASLLAGVCEILKSSSGPAWNRRHNFFKKLCTPDIPAVFHGFACSNGPKNISYIRRVSAPYWRQISSGLTTLYFDLDIFSTSRVTLKLPSSSVTKAASLNSTRQFLKA
ncbi:MAG: Uncharacterised protein [Flavobacteriaceae bacterium]|nr:MAG: Uncharacterised protein [Flavobacteriaceae bacterium]